jgi:hypothetical protein
MPIAARHQRAGGGEACRASGAGKNAEFAWGRTIQLAGTTSCSALRGATESLPAREDPE